MDHGGGLGAPSHEPPVNRIRTWIALFGLLAALVLVFTACASSGPNTQTTRTDKVAVLGGVADLRERFNEDSGKVRLVLLVSPT